MAAKIHNFREEKLRATRDAALSLVQPKKGLPPVLTLWLASLAYRQDLPPHFLDPARVALLTA